MLLPDQTGLELKVVVIRNKEALQWHLVVAKFNTISTITFEWQPMVTFN